MAKEAVLLFGTFNPVTNAHIALGDRVQKLLPDADVIYIPCNGRFLHSWKKLDGQQIFSDEERVRLLTDAVTPRGFQVDSLEVQGLVDGKTYHTVAYFKERYEKVFLCMGMDKVGEFHLWYRAEELLGENRFLICTRSHLHIDDVKTELVEKYRDHFREVSMEDDTQDISATQIREAFLEGTLDLVRDKIPCNVYEFLKKASAQTHS